MKLASISAVLLQSIYNTAHCMGKIKTESAFVCLVCVFKNW